MATITREQVIQATPDYETPRQTATLGFIQSGVAGIRQTLKIMREIVKEYRKNPELRALAERLIFNVPEKNAVAECRTVFEYVRDCIRYTSDIHDVETLKTPDATVFSAQGDCDDKSTLLATLLETIGYTTRFVAVGMNSPGVFEHVYVQVRLGTRWIGMDATENVTMGWEPPNPVAYMVWHI